MGNFLKLDWLAFTYFAPTSSLIASSSPAPTSYYRHNCPSAELDSFMRVMPELKDIWQLMEIRGSKNHYTQSMAIGGDFICCFNEDGVSNNMGVNFEVPSHSLRLFMELLGINPDADNCVHELMALLYNRGCFCSRIDLCYDDDTLTFRPWDFIGLWNNNCFKTHFRKAIFMSSGQGRRAGNTFYLGNLKKRDKVLRVYDKDVESNGEVNAVRYEFELHSRYAQEMQKFLITNRLLFSTYICEWFEIINPIYSERRNCPISDEWKAFLDKVVDKDKFCEQLSVCDICVPKLTGFCLKQSRKEYVEKSIIKVLKDYVSYYGMEALQDKIQRADNSSRFRTENEVIKLRSMQFTSISIFKPDNNGFQYSLFNSPFDACEVPTSAQLPS